MKHSVFRGRRLADLRPGRPVRLGSVRAIGALLALACGGGDTLIFNNPKVLAVTVSPTTVSVRVGETTPLAANVSVSGGAATTLNWTTSDASRAGVSTDGVVTGRQTGAVSVTATSAVDGTKSAFAQVTVLPARVALVTVAPTGPLSLAVGGAATLAATVRDGAGNIITDRAVTWLSSAASVASVSTAGAVAALAAGSASITASADGVSSAAVVLNVAVATARVTIAASGAGGGRITSQAMLSPPIDCTTNGPTLTGSCGADYPVGTSVTLTALPRAGSALAAWSGPCTGSTTCTFAIGQGTTVTANFIVTQAVTAWSGSQVGDGWGPAGPATSFVYGMWGASSGAIWVGTEGGQIARWNGTTWNVEHDARASIWGVGGASTSEVYAVGANGTVRRFNGASWSSMTSGTVDTLFDVWASGVGSAFAVGANGRILRLSGSTWTRLTSNTTERLRGVWGTSANDVFAVGENGTIMHFDGTSWRSMVSGTTRFLRRVWLRNATAGYAVGDGGVILRWDGATWSPMVTNTGSAFWSVRGDVATGTVYAGSAQGRVFVLRPGASTWLPLPTEPSFPDAYISLFVEDAGSFVAGGTQGYTTRFAATATDSTWSRLSVTPSFFAVSVWSSTAAFAVGSFGSAVRFNGAGWLGGAGVASGSLIDVSATSANTAIAVGNAGAFRFDGSTWQAMSFSSGAVPLNAVWATSTNNAHASALGTMYRWQGNSWSAVSAPIAGNVMMNTMWGANASDVWAGGPGGTLIRWDGATWRLVSTGVLNAISHIWGLNANTVYAGGTQGTLLRFDGTSWTPMPFPETNVSVNGIWGSSVNDLYIATSDASIWRWDGASFGKMVHFPTDPNLLVNPLSLNSLAGDRGTFAIAVGSGGLLVRGGSGVASSGNTLGNIRLTGRGMRARGGFRTDARTGSVAGDGVGMSRLLEPRSRLSTPPIR